jgi:hypothetical protein
MEILKLEVKDKKGTLANLIRGYILSPEKVMEKCLTQLEELMMSFDNGAIGWQSYLACLYELTDLHLSAYDMVTPETLGREVDEKGNYVFNDDQELLLKLVNGYRTESKVEVYKQISEEYIYLNQVVGAIEENNITWHEFLMEMRETARHNFKAIDIVRSYKEVA